MKVTVGAWAWFEKSALGELQQETLRRTLTIVPKKLGDYPGEDPGPIRLYAETEAGFGVAREFFLQRRRIDHDVEFAITEGDKTTWPGDFAFNGTLFEEQSLALQTVIEKLKNGQLGGILKAPPGWGKTVFACALMAALQVPTLVVVHKEFLMNQWRERILGSKSKKIPAFLPTAKVGFIQQNVCDFKGKNIAIAMVHSLVKREYPMELYKWPGLVLFDETHRVAAQTWSQVPSLFPAKHRIGFSATPRRKDGADSVFFYHIGPILFDGREKRLIPGIRKVRTEFRLVRTPMFNPNLIHKTLLLRFMCGNEDRNNLIISQLIQAVRAGRKILVLSERLNHLRRLHTALQEQWPVDAGPVPSMGYYIGGQSEEDLDAASECQVIFATSQLVTEGLDIPPLDTLFLTTPLSDVEQAVGRLLRPVEGKKDPVVVDFIDQHIDLCVRSARSRDRQYEEAMRKEK